MGSDNSGSAEHTDEAIQPDAELAHDRRQDGEERFHREAESRARAELERLKHAYQKSTAEARLLYEAGRLLGSTLDPETIFETMRKLVSGIMPVDTLLVSSFDPQTNLITCSYAWIEGNRADVSGFPAVPLSPDGSGMQSTVILTGKPLMVLDAFERAMNSKSHFHVDPDGTVHDHPDPHKPQSHSILMVPIKLEDQVLGIVQVQSLQKGAYTEDDLRILEAMVLQMAAANRNAFLYQQVREELTERQRTEQALRESETQYRTLVETSTDLIWSLDAEGKVLFVNQEAHRILGFDPEEMIGRPITDFLADERDRKNLEDFPRFLRDKTQLRYEMAFRCKKGTAILLAINGVVLRDDRGNVVGATGTAADITEHRRLQEQLLQAQKMESIGRLAGGIAHDFNNLMTAILGYASLAQMSLPSEGELSADLQRIQQAARRASELTQQLLAFARKQIAEPKIVNLNDLILDIDKMLRRLIGADVELIILPKADLWHVRIDPGQFGQVLVNLAVNARGAMPNGGKLIIETDNITLGNAYGYQGAEGRAGDYVMLAVTDTGIGMTPEVQAHLFEPFFTTKEVGKGTGLGLATCYGIVQQSGGHIQVESEPGRGTTFRIYLPRTEAPAKSGARAEAPKTLPGGTETLLLVEDNPMVRELGVQTLTALGYTVLAAANGNEALRLVDQHEGQIALLISDVIMPQMGGVELAQRLHEKRPGIPVLFTSGYTATTLASGYRGLPPDQPFLQKPFTPTVLAQKVRQILDASK